MGYVLWQRLLGKKVVFITGTDEHGEKIATAAAAQGSNPSEHCDVISQAYKSLWKDVMLTHHCNLLSVFCNGVVECSNCCAGLKFLLLLFICFLQLDISYDKFIRTTDPKHEAIVKEFYSRVLANGDIYRADYEGLYCVNCEEYKVVFQLKL
jgi:methionyl-tRNA synthetase